jgi:hypothetical protein
MYQGEIMIYAGIGLVTLSVLLFIVFSVVFSARKKKVIKNIYGE